MFNQQYTPLYCVPLLWPDTTTATVPKSNHAVELHVPDKSFHGAPNDMLGNAQRLRIRKELCFAHFLRRTNDEIEKTQMDEAL